MTGLTKQIMRAVTIAAIGWVSLAAPSMAQTRFPANEATKDTKTKSCTLILVPSVSTESTAPRLKLGASLDPKREKLTLSIDTRKPLVSSEMVAANQRVPFTGESVANARGLAKTQIWAAISASHKAQEPFFLTGKTTSGEYASSRYDDLDPKGIIALLEAQCGYDGSDMFPESVASLAKKENALRLNENQVRHIRWVLARTINNAVREPRKSKTFTADDRNSIAQYARRKGKPARKYLSRDLANMLLKTKFTPVTPDHTSSRNFKRSGQWATYRATSDTCALTTPAKTWSGMNLFRSPEMKLSVKTTDSGARMYFDLLTPNPFVPNSVRFAVVDGRRYPIEVRGRTIVPGPDGKYMSTAIARALKRGREISFNGTVEATRRNGTISFSASGFSSGFNRLGVICGRRDIKRWLQ